MKAFKSSTAWQTGRDLGVRCRVAGEGGTRHRLGGRTVRLRREDVPREYLFIVHERWGNRRAKVQPCILHQPAAFAHSAKAVARPSTFARDATPHSKVAPHHFSSATQSNQTAT